MIESSSWLPIGSVVHIEGYDEDPIMITACMVGLEEDGSLWDYAGIPYPEGVTTHGQDILFDKDGIDAVFYVGYQSPDGERYQDALVAAEPAFNEAKLKSRASR
jgi:hypothetical protein